MRFIYGGTAVKIDGELVRYRIERIGTDRQICYSNRRVPQDRMVTHTKTETAVQFSNQINNGCHLINSIVSNVMNSCMSRTSGRGDFHFYTAFMSTVDIHLGWFTDDK